MTTLTVQELVNRANITDFAAYAKKLNLGDIIAGLVPKPRTLSGLASNATQVHDVAAALLFVQTPVGTNLAQITAGSPGAGEVSVDYDAEGIPTLIFAAAVTTYTVVEQTLPANLTTELARKP